MMMLMGTKRTMPYAVSFDAALKDAVETKPGNGRDEVMVDLLKRPDARQAHPTFEHLLPIHVAVGASGEDQGRQLWTLAELSLAWAQYRFGEVSA
jgi:aromatic ring-opening dioxygenase catalytic subunit (LigB family)